MLAWHHYIPHVLEYFIRWMLFLIKQVLGKELMIYEGPAFLSLWRPIDDLKRILNEHRPRLVHAAKQTFRIVIYILIGLPMYSL
jgi:hypothetical protein